ncbi:folate family ECF transporter S component [Butyrivibrio sp. WCD3002]|jgi:ECF transporter S component (folate family)|uniref:folate family ECF transporter S component n=1 Tax=Butyrivibrio sp. WCD3002 TaxID=1280676 RepID=UPI000400CB76|nr:folate family ECF transporter S component [Butyrivibrio sp. WCD3002]
MSQNYLSTETNEVTVNRWIASLKEFKHLRNVTFCGMLAAIAIILGYVATFNIGNYIRIGFSGLPNQVVDYLFGPAVGAIFGAALDVIKWFLKPTGDFFPGFTISAALGGIIYGYAFYKKNITIVRVLVAQLIVKVFVNICLNSIWLKLLYGQALLAMLPGRIISNSVMLPIDTFITFVMLKAIDKTIRPMFR